MKTQTVVIRLEWDGRSISNGAGQEASLAPVGKQLRWKGTDAGFVELIYGLKLAGMVEADGRPADVKDVTEALCSVFGMELPNVYYTHMSNQKRKKDRTPLLNSLIKALLGEVVIGEGE